MNVYEYLRLIKKYDYRVKCAQEEIERLSQLATTASAVDYSVERVQNGKANQEPSFVNTLDKLTEARKKFDELIKEYMRLRDHIYEQVSEMPDALQARVIYLHYFEFMNLYQVAKDTNYSYNWIRIVFTNGIKSFTKLHGEEFEEL